jgi:hypothetical protein
MNRPYAIYRNGLLWRRRKTEAFAMRDVRELQAAGFTAEYKREDR